MDRNIYLELLTPNHAREKWLMALAEFGFELETEILPLTEALGRYVSKPVAALRSSPAFHGAAMDGVAVNAADTYHASCDDPVSLRIGKNAFWINTGHPLPEGTNAVIMVEQINLENNRDVVIEKAVYPWSHVRKIGEDIVATEIILTPGTQIGPYELGALAAGGILNVPVFKKPKVAIIPTGNEITPLNEASEEDLASGKILPEFNSLIISGILEQAGANSYVTEILPDNLEQIIETIKRESRKADLIIINAGASAGSRDFTSKAIKASGSLLAHGIAMMPGKPAALGYVIDDRNPKKVIPVLGAPGYPVSAIMAVEEFAIPLICDWQKRPIPKAQEIEVYPVVSLPSRTGLEERIRVKLGKVNNKYYAVPLPRGAGTITSLSFSDAIISIPPQSEGCEAGKPVTAKLLRSPEQIEGGLLAIGSHDNTLEIIDSLLRKKTPGYHLASVHIGSLGGIMAIKAGQAHLAGTHLLDLETGIYNQGAIKKYLKGMAVNLVRLVEREQGLIIKKGNPKNIKSLNDLARADINFINRQAGSGTRVLLDYQLAKNGIKKENIKGYENEEYTHMNVAAAVQSGRADAGLGVRAAANALDLDFIPIGVEEYDLIIPDCFMEDKRIQTVLEIIKSEDFKKHAQALGGYGTERSGEIIWSQKN